MWSLEVSGVLSETVFVNINVLFGVVPNIYKVNNPIQYTYIFLILFKYIDFVGNCSNKNFNFKLDLKLNLT